jgi:uncharacterized protein YndB with AHSA1/START domain
MSTDRIEKQIVVKAPLAKVWRALADSKEFGTWFGVRFDEPFAPGKHMRGVMAPTAVSPEVAKLQKPYEGRAFEITIEKMEPERLFSFRWHPFAIEEKVDYSAEPTTLVVFALEERPGGVHLTVTESGFDRIPIERRAKAFQANDHGWTLMVTVVEKYVAGP